MRCYILINIYTILYIYIYFIICNTSHIIYMALFSAYVFAPSLQRHRCLLRSHADASAQWRRHCGLERTDSTSAGSRTRSDTGTDGCTEMAGKETRTPYTPWMLSSLSSVLFE